VPLIRPFAASVTERIVHCFELVIVGSEGSVNVQAITDSDIDTKRISRNGAKHPL
jgi:hypothetical protein